MTIFEVLWELPVVVAYQIFYVHLQIQGNTLTTGPTQGAIFARLNRCHGANHSQL